MTELSHTDKEGRARMVDVGGKPVQHRVAHAQGFIKLNPETIQLIKNNLVKKGDVLSVAEIAGIQAAKATSSLIPLCHPLPITQVLLTLSVEKQGIKADAVVKCTGQTGVEMEALTAVSVSLLTVYDMCKAADKSMVIENVRLIEKTKTNI